MSQGDFDLFMKLVRSALGPRPVQSGPDDGGALAVTDVTGHTWTIGLVNLAQMCSSAPRDDWPRIITQHFESLFEPESEPGTWDEAAPMLRIRLIPDGYESGTDYAGELVARRIADGLRAAVALDRPRTVQLLYVELTEAWHVPHDTIYQRALENVRLHEQPQIETLDDGPVTVLVGDSPYTASHLLALADFMPEGAPNRAVVAVPNRHVVLFAPILDVGIAKSINRIAEVASALYRDGPGSVSPDLYWWRDGDFVLLPTSVDEQSIQFFPPDEFVDLLNTLPPAEASSN